MMKSCFFVCCSLASLFFNESLSTFASINISEYNLGKNEGLTFTVLQKDIMYDGKLIAALGHGIVSIDEENKTITHRVGRPDEPGYKEGEGALFRDITGILQKPNGKIIVSDHGNYCLRWFNFNETFVHNYVGHCENQGHATGSRVIVRFNGPRRLVSYDQEVSNVNKKHLPTAKHDTSSWIIVQDDNEQSQTVFRRLLLREVKNEVHVDDLSVAQPFESLPMGGFIPISDMLLRKAYITDDNSADRVFISKLGIGIIAVNKLNIVWIFDISIPGLPQNFSIGSGEIGHFDGLSIAESTLCTPVSLLYTNETEGETETIGLYIGEMNAVRKVHLRSEYNIIVFACRKYPKYFLWMTKSS